MNICLLTTRLNSVWLSMQEIIPALENQWIRFAKKERYSLESVLVDDDPCLKKELTKILCADVIIVTAFNHKMAMAMRVIRQYVGIQSPFVFYLHGQATIGLWPLEELNVLSLLDKRDVFISTSTNDKQCFDQLFKNKKAIIIPFQLNDQGSSGPEKSLWQESPGIADFVYIGRVSEQKNIHTLIYAMSLMKSQDFRLHVIGGEDHLGSPNMEIKSEKYLELLKTLTAQLRLSDRVYFHGFQKREELQSFLKKQHYTFISPSLHSDENFGMAAFWSLCHGSTALLTDWGGHADFKTYFKDQVELVPVSLGKSGPYIEIHHFVNALEKMMNEPTREHEASYPEYYHDHYAFELLRKLLASPSDTESLASSDFLKEVLNQRSFFKTKYSTKVFKNYEDPLAHQFFQTYGAKVENRASGERKYLLPWVQEGKSSFIVQDPHRGTFVFKKKSELMTSDFAHF